MQADSDAKAKSFIISDAVMKVCQPCGGNVGMLWSCLTHLRASVTINSFYRHIFTYIKPYLHLVQIMAIVLLDAFVVEILQLLFYFTDSSQQNRSRNKMEDPWQRAYDFAVAVARKAGEVQLLPFYFSLNASIINNPYCFSLGCIMGNKFLLIISTIRKFEKLVRVK